MPTQGGRGIASLATATNAPFRSGFECEGDWNRVRCCHTMSNQYELPRAVGPQRHISSKVALNTEMVAALKFTSVHRLETHTYGSILRHFVWRSLQLNTENPWTVLTAAAQAVVLGDFTTLTLITALKKTLKIFCV